MIAAGASSIRLETDGMGPIEVPAERYYGAQTARSLVHFAIGDDVMPHALIEALAIVKQACAQVNADLGKLNGPLAELIVQAAQEVVDGKHAEEFPLSVWQTGSGTQTNMNVNEVIANRANELAGHGRGEKKPVHPNDHVNMSQSSNDVFPTAMHLATARAFKELLLPSVETLRDALAEKAAEFAHVVKIGRTHLMDAVPLTMGQEFSGYVAQLDGALGFLRGVLPALLELAIGGTAVGTGLNAHVEFGARVAQRISNATNMHFVSAPNKFAALAAHDALVQASGALRTLACALLKIANDVRWMGSGPRCGLAELRLPANEPGSSIMPGKVNPTQCEALAMVCIQVMGNDLAIALAGSQGNFELNVFKPLIIHNLLRSIRLVSDACVSFARFCVNGLQPNLDRLAEYVRSSPMLVTALNERIGYDNATHVVKASLQTGKSPREICVELGLLTGDEFDQLVSVARAPGNG